MTVTLEIPDDLAERPGGDLPRRALEAFVLEEYKAGRMHKPDVRRLLDLSWHGLEEFLKKHEVLEECTIEDIRRDIEDLRTVLGSD